MLDEVVVVDFKPTERECELWWKVRRSLEANGKTSCHYYTMALEYTSKCGGFKSKVKAEVGNGS
jgi:hypothetical protein